MPEETVPLAETITRLAILGADGSFDEELEPTIDDELLGRLHEYMLLARRFDERLLRLQRQGSIGTFAPVQGQEAANLGPVASLDEQDWMLPSFRETAAQLWRGLSMENLLLAKGGYNEGAAVPKGGRTLPEAVPVASQIPHANGIAYAEQLRESGQVVMVYFGDGATSEGDFHEALNVAAVWSLPVIFVCQNNQWAISLPREEQTAAATLAQKALAYGMPGLQVDGNDLLACFEAGRRAVARARAGDGPMLIECVTYRDDVRAAAEQAPSDDDQQDDDQRLETSDDEGPVERRPLRGLRRSTAKHLHHAWTSIPHVMHQEEVAIDELMDFRETMVEEGVGKPPPHCLPHQGPRRRPRSPPILQHQPRRGTRRDRLQALPAHRCGHGHRARPAGAGDPRRRPQEPARGGGPPARTRRSGRARQT